MTDRGGVALIPAFALGRAQEIIQIILAYRDQLNAPVYVDGMVRSVCQGYAGFSDLLPSATVKAASDDHLFFRDSVKPVNSRNMREDVARAPGPAVVVASSGMLTGGASVVYARHIAADERNAIFLTGYQDEEAPGRALQRMMREREQTDAFTWNMDGHSVTVRCQIDTYSLSAHADEMELVNLAESFDAGEVMLVHGDGSARHSLASALAPAWSSRDHAAYRPDADVRVWQTALGLWVPSNLVARRVRWMTAPCGRRSKGRPAAFFSAKELAQMWWGDAGRGAEAAHALQDSVYFAADWRDRNTFKVRTEAQARRTQRQRAIMMANPDLVGKVVMLRDVNNRPRLGRVMDAGIEGFEADVAGTKGRHYPADAILWVMGAWERKSDAGGVKSQLNASMKKAKAHVDTLLPFALRQKLVLLVNP